MSLALLVIRLSCCLFMSAPLTAQRMIRHIILIATPSRTPTSHSPVRLRIKGGDEAPAPGQIDAFRASLRLTAVCGQRHGVESAPAGST